MYKSLLLALVWGMSSIVFAQMTNYQNALANTDGDTLAPYFELAEGQVITLQSSSADISIDGTIADVKVMQRYINPGNEPIEAIYVFPGSSRAAVYALTMTINERVIKAKIQEKQKARATYEKAKAEGKSASLLEQDRPNVFTMNVANILPGDVIEVELRYTELVNVEDAQYELVYPLGETSSVNLTINSGIPLQKVESPTHIINTQFLTPSQTQVNVEQKRAEYGTSDFIVRYQLAGNEIQTGAMLTRQDEENFFIVQIEPPEVYKTESIVNREYVFVVDVSGSMTGFPIGVSKKLIAELLNGLNPWERFNVVFFAGASQVLSEQSLPATQDNIDNVIKMLSNIKGSGSTNLLNAIKAVNSVKVPDGYSRTVLAITDGYISYDLPTLNTIANSVEDTNYFAFGIGTRSVHRNVIESIARAGFGEPFYAATKKEAKEKGATLFDVIRTPLLADIDIEFDGFDVYDVQPEFVPDMFAKKPLVVYGKWRGEAKGKIIVSGVTGEGAWKKTIEINESNIVPYTQSLKYIWARKEIENNDDYYHWSRDEDERKKLQQRITSLGLQYNLLTQFTSFVAVDELVRTSPQPLATAEEKSSRPPLQSMGYSIAPLLANISTSTMDTLEVGKDEQLTKISDKEFIKQENLWVDLQHSAMTPVLVLQRSSSEYQKLLALYPILNKIPKTGDFIISFGEVSLHITNSKVGHIDSSLLDWLIFHASKLHASRLHASSKAA